jgi:hypothetical protein
MPKGTIVSVVYKISNQKQVKRFKSPDIECTGHDAERHCGGVKSLQRYWLD